VFPIMTDPRATDLSAPMLSADETMPRPTHATHAHATERLDDVAPHRAFGPGRPGNLVVTPETATHGLEVLRREALGARQLGHRLLAQVESQDLLLSELKKTIAAIESEASDGARVTLQRLSRTAHEVMEWCDAVQLELEAEGRHAVAGLQAIDVLDLVHDVLHDLSRAGSQRIVYVAGHANASVWASVPALGRVLRLAIELVDARIESQGAIHVEVGEDDDGHFVRVVGNGEAKGEPGPDRVEEFRDAAESAHVAVLRDEQTGGAAGLVLRIATSARGPLLPIA
jgi:hypothetical protein